MKSGTWLRMTIWTGALTGVAAGAHAQVTAYDNFGPGFGVASGASTGFIMGTSIAGSAPRQTRQLFVPTAGGTVTDVWIHVTQTGVSSAPTNIQVRLATADPDMLGPEAEHVLESWTVANLSGGDLLHLTSQLNPRLEAGQNYWLWVTIGGGRGTWRYSPDTFLAQLASQRDAGQAWAGLTVRRQGSLRVDLLPSDPSCPADFNGSGGAPDDADVAAFFFAWNNGDESADLNGSGGTPDDADIAYFFFRWNEGC